MTKNIQKYSCIAIGNFDGIHKGHDTLIKRMISLSKQEDFQSIILTFKYSDIAMKKSSKNLKYITSFQNKILRLQNYNVDNVAVLDLNTEISKYSPEKFIEEILINQYNVKHVIVGYNFSFGYKASGNVEVLQKYADKYAYKVTVIEPISYNGQEISSTIIRKYILAGEIHKVNNLLANNYEIFCNDVSYINNTEGIVNNNSEIIIPLDGEYNVLVGAIACKLKIITQEDNKKIIFDKAINTQENIIFIDN